MAQTDYSGNMAGLVIGVMVATWIFWKLFIQPIRVVRHSEVMIVERFGRFQAVLRPGIHWVWPLVESTRKVHWRYAEANSSNEIVVKTIQTDRIDCREHCLHLGQQLVISRDSVQLKLDSLAFFRVSDPKKALYSAQDLMASLELLCASSLRQAVAALTLDDIFASREQISAELLSRMQKDVDRWGVSLLRIELLHVNVPEDIAEAMVRQITAERERRSVVLRADGERESTIIQSRGKAAQLILQAEGNRASTILRAKGAAEARKVLADAEAQCLGDIRSAVSGFGMRGTDYLSAIEYLNSLSRLTSAGAEKVVMVPVESMDLMGGMLKAGAPGGVPPLGRA